MNTCTATKPSRLALATLIACGFALAQENVERRRPEQGGALPDFVVTDAVTGTKTSIHAALAAPPGDAPLVIAFVHRDKDLCVRFVKELGEQIAALGEARTRCAIHLVFPGEEHEGAAIDAARELAAPFRLDWDSDRSAYQAMGMIAFPTVYVVDRETRTIQTLRRGYKVSLAQEVAARLRVGLGLMTEEEFARLMRPAEEVPVEVKQRAARIRQAHQLLRSGKADTALELFDAVLAEVPEESVARAGRAIAMWKLGREGAYELLTAAREELPEDTGVALALAGWLLQHDRLDEAEPLIRSVIERDPAPAFYALGQMYERRGNWKDAAIAYREAAARLLH